MQDRAQRVLVVDADDEIRELVTTGLVRAGFEVVHAATAAAARQRLTDHQLDLVVCDMTLPDGSGLDLLRGTELPVIMIAAHADEADLVIGLELGADDFVAKPFSTRELIARSRAVLRRCVRSAEPTATLEVPSGGAIAYDELRIDPAAREVVNAGKELSLTRMEFDLLHWLAEHPRQVFTKAHLLRTVWGCEQGWVNEATVTEHVRRIRRKLEGATGAAWITTVWGVGYRFEPPVPSASVHHLRTAV